MDTPDERHSGHEDGREVPATLFTGLAFIAVLGVVGFLVQQSPVSQAAQAQAAAAASGSGSASASSVPPEDISTMSSPPPSNGSTASTDAPVSCQDDTGYYGPHDASGKKLDVSGDDAVTKAVKLQQPSDGPAKTLGAKGTTDLCYGAVMKETATFTPASPTSTKDYTFINMFAPSSYRCVGRSVFIYQEGGNTISVSWPNGDLKTPGKCLAYVCDRSVDPNKLASIGSAGCKPASEAELKKIVAGGSGPLITGGASLSGDSSTADTSSWFGTAAGSDTTSDSFKDQPTGQTYDTSTISGTIAKNNAAIDDIKKIVNSCDSRTTNCDFYDKRLIDLKKENDSLQKQLAVGRCAGGVVEHAFPEQPYWHCCSSVSLHWLSRSYSAEPLQSVLGVQFFGD